MNTKSLESRWLAHIHAKTKSKESGVLSFCKEITKEAVTLSWHVSDILSPELSNFKFEVSDLAAQVTASTELHLLKAYPESLNSGGFFNACKHLLNNEKTDWNRVEATLNDSIRQFYRMDVKLFGEKTINILKDDSYFFASAKDSVTNKLLGFIIASVTPALPYGVIKIITLIVEPQERAHGIESLLIATILKTIPQTRNLFTFIRPTDREALKAYQACGFVVNDTPFIDVNHRVSAKYFTALDYSTNQSTFLQDRAKTLN